LMPRSYNFGTRVTPYQPKGKVRINFGKRKGCLATCIKWNIRNNKWLIRIEEGDDAGKKMHYPEKKMDIFSDKKNYVAADGTVKLADGQKAKVAGLDIATEAYEKRKADAAAAKNSTTLGKTGKDMLQKALGPKAEDIPPPDGLKDGDSWEAGRQNYNRDDGKTKTVTTYTIKHPDRSFTKSVVTVEYNGDTSINNVLHPAPDGPPDDSDVIPDPPGLPDGAGWGAEKEKLERSDGKTKTIITYTVNTCGGKTYKIVVTKNYNGTKTVQEIGK